MTPARFPMPFNPTQYLGCPVPVLMAELGRKRQEDLWPQGKVDLHSCSVQEPVTRRPHNLMSTTIAEADLATDHPEIDIPGVVLETYLGGGSQGWVYAGRVVATGALVAVKVLRGDYVAARGWAAREALLCARVRHRNVLRVFKTQPAGVFWVVLMELIQGAELQACQITLAQLRQCLIQLADALQALRRGQIVHGDIKPGNIVVRHDGSPVLVDFGVAWDLTTDTELTGISGTPYYLAPETFHLSRPHASWDAYALGVTGVSMLGLRQEYDSLNTLRQAKMSGEFDRVLIGNLGRLADDPLRGWLASLLHANPEQRLAALDTAEKTLAV